MLIELIVMILVGALCIVMGLLIWKKEKISLIHSYHYKKVKEEDKPAYTTMMGQGLIAIGIGCVLTGLVNHTMQSAGGWIWFGLCFFYGFARISKAQKRYNGGFF